MRSRSGFLVTKRIQLNEAVAYWVAQLAVGPAVVAGSYTNIWIYFIACPLGAAAAALLYHHVILAPCRE